MSRVIIAEREGFRTTWVSKKKDHESHKWWHLFFRIVQMVVIESNIKSRKYIRSRTWITTCRKCDFKKIESREVWLPGEVIPEHDTIENVLDLAKELKGLDSMSEKNEL